MAAWFIRSCLQFSLQKERLFKISTLLDAATVSLVEKLLRQRHWECDCIGAVMVNL